MEVKNSKQRIYDTGAPAGLPGWLEVNFIEEHSLAHALSQKFYHDNPIELHCPECGSSDRLPRFYKLLYLPEVMFIATNYTANDLVTMSTTAFCNIPEYLDMSYLLDGSSFDQTHEIGKSLSLYRLEAVIGFPNVPLDRSGHYITWVRRGKDRWDFINNDPGPGEPLRYTMQEMNKQENYRARNLFYVRIRGVDAERIEELDLGAIEPPAAVQPSKAPRATGNSKPEQQVRFADPQEQLPTPPPEIKMHETLEVVECSAHETELAGKRGVTEDIEAMWEKKQAFLTLRRRQTRQQTVVGSGDTEKPDDSNRTTPTAKQTPVSRSNIITTKTQLASNDAPQPGIKETQNNCEYPDFTAPKHGETPEERRLRLEKARVWKEKEAEGLKAMKIIQDWREGRAAEAAISEKLGGQGKKPIPIYIPPSKPRETGVGTQGGGRGGSPRRNQPRPPPPIPPRAPQPTRVPWSIDTNPNDPRLAESANWDVDRFREEFVAERLNAPRGNGAKAPFWLKIWKQHFDQEKKTYTIYSLDGLKDAAKEHFIDVPRKGRRAPVKKDYINALNREDQRRLFEYSRNGGRPLNDTPHPDSIDPPAPAVGNRKRKYGNDPQTTEEGEEEVEVEVVEVTQPARRQRTGAKT